MLFAADNGAAAMAEMHPDSKRFIPSNMFRPVAASATIPNPTSPFPLASPSGSDLNPNAAAAAGHERSSAMSRTCSPRLARISAWQ
jgi:hypothetical protein